MTMDITGDTIQRMPVFSKLDCFLTSEIECIARQLLLATRRPGDSTRQAQKNLENIGYLAIYLSSNLQTVEAGDPRSANDFDLHRFIVEGSSNVFIGGFSSWRLRQQIQRFHDQVMAQLSENVQNPETAVYGIYAKYLDRIVSQDDLCNEDIRIELKKNAFDYDRGGYQNGFHAWFQQHTAQV